MAGRIHKLDPLVSSQIAAGEVVERPASAVKELVENSLDAGARRITIDIEDGGLSVIRVSDDGGGMSPEDAPVALERFATSKLSGAEDLTHITTLGFRGEALPSIAACSRTTVETAVQGASGGISLRTEAGRILTTEEKGLAQGTTVTVDDLFFNTPARRKFMKSKGSERQAIVDVVQRLALAWPEVAFTLRSGGNVVLRTFGLGLRNAVADIFGPAEAALMVPVGPAAGVSGFAGLPSLYRRQRDRQLFSINQRPVRNPALGWALDQAFEGLLPPKCYPVAALDISLPAGDVDVNVHPTKAEVRFRNDREVRSGLTSAVRDALEKAGYDSLGATGRSAGGPAATSWSRPYPPSAKTAGLPGVQDTGGQVRWGLLRDLPREEGRLPGDAVGPGAATAGGSTQSDMLPEGWQYMGSIMDTYLVAQTPSSLLVIDKHALMESLVYRALASDKTGGQELLVAEMLHLSPQEALAYEESGGALDGVGFGSRLVGDRTVMVTRVPLVLGTPVEPGSLKAILAHLVDRGDATDPAVALAAARVETAACHASVRAREPLSREEACALLRELHRTPEARVCPHGRPTVKELPVGELALFFGRTSHDPDRLV